MTERIPSELRYTKDHEWARMEGEEVVIGITDHAQQALGDITYVELPEPGREAAQTEELATIESAKAASDIFAPVSGVVSAVNEALEDEPGKVNADPYGEGWLCRLAGVDAGDLDNLMSAEEYEQLLAQETA